MPRARNPDTEKAEALFHKGMKLIDIAKELDLPEGTVRRWKSSYKWDSERSEKKVSVRKNKIEHIEPIAEEVKQVMNNSSLTDKQQLFCIYYVKYFNATKAYQKAYGCDYATALSIGYRLLENDGVKKEIQSLKQNKLNRAMLDPEDVFQKYMDIAFSDVTDFVSFGQEEIQVMGAFGPVFVKDDETGEKVPVTKIVNTVKFKESCEVDGTIISEVSQGKDGAKIKLADRMKALDWLANHIDLATEEQKQRIENLKANTAKIKGEDPEADNEDDGFMKALEGKVDEVWQEE